MTYAAPSLNASWPRHGVSSPLAVSGYEGLAANGSRREEASP